MKDGVKNLRSRCSSQLDEQRISCKEDFDQFNEAFFTTDDCALSFTNLQAEFVEKVQPVFNMSREGISYGMLNEEGFNEMPLSCVKKELKTVFEIFFSMYNEWDQKMQQHNIY